MATATSVTEVFGANVRRLRQERGWSQAELGKRCGRNFVSICNIEHGHTETNIGTACRIADAFHVTIEKLFE